EEEKRKIIKMRNLVGYSWGQGHFKVKASDYTDDVMNETADLTLGDAWIPPYKFDGRGNNILIVRNPDLLQIIKEGIDSNKINLDEISTQQAYASQPGHFRHTVDELPYRIQKRQHENLWVPETRVDILKQIPYLRKKVQDIREEIRETSRELYISDNQNSFSLYINKMKKLEKKYQMVYSLIEIRRLGFRKSLVKAYRKTRK
ncbi:MAG TPA: coenzyme F420 hydrogenase, partial [Flavobacteriaceae bacterium]|nr:coenzyme F420 hydrogenase [Flavobacteriaceae bacterium]